jgi:hypothetical protein
MRCHKLFSLFLFFAFAHGHPICAKTADSAKNRREFSNTIKLSHGGFYVREWQPLYKPFQNGFSGYQLGVNYDESRAMQFLTVGGTFERRIYKCWFAGATFMQWKSLAYTQDNPYFIKYPYRVTGLNIGDVYDRLNYKMIDIYGFYRYNIGHHRHFITAGVGVTHCWGTDEAIEFIYINPDPPHDVVVELSDAKANYWGAMPFLGYDFLFFRNRFVIGPDIRAKYYIHRSPAEYDISFHLGVNF